MWFSGTVQWIQHQMETGVSCPGVQIHVDRGTLGQWRVTSGKIINPKQKARSSFPSSPTPCPPPTSNWWIIILVVKQTFKLCTLSCEKKKNYIHFMVVNANKTLRGMLMKVQIVNSYYLGLVDSRPSERMMSHSQ